MGSRCSRRNERAPVVQGTASASTTATGHPSTTTPTRGQSGLLAGSGWSGSAAIPRSARAAAAARPARAACQSAAAAGGVFGQTGRGGGHGGIVALPGFDRRGVEGAAVRPRGDTRLGAVRARGQGAAHLHPRPGGERVGKGVGRTQSVALAVV